MTKPELVVESTRLHRARVLKYYLRQPCAPSFVKSRMLRPLQTHFLLFPQIFFILVSIHARNPRVSGFGPEYWPRGQNPAGATITIKHCKSVESMIITAIIFWLSGYNFNIDICLLYTSPSPRDQRGSRMPSSA